MILRCQVVTVTRNRKGQPIRSAKVVAGDPITVGRGGDATVHLPDPRVHLRHAVIRNDDLGKLWVEALEAQIDVNGELRSRAKVRRGDRILIGPYRILPEPPTGPDHDFTLAIELVQPYPEEMVDLRARSRTTLNATWLPKRALAWALFALVAALGLALPIAYATSPRFKQAAGASTLPASVAGVAWDTVWDPGPLSSGHQALSRRCDACHQIPFERVRDAACTKCHVSTGAHVSAASAGKGVVLGTRCVDCHRDHKGQGASHTDTTPCSDCHRDLKGRYPTTTVASASDFAADHPAFALSVLNPRTGSVEKVAADRVATYREESGLKFPHATHLSPKGVRSPTGLRRLECGQCHRLDVASLRFQPVKMTEDCAECHRLEFEPAVTSRQAPHGDPALILTQLREFYSRIALGERPIDVTLVNDLLRRPVAPANRVEQANARAWAEAKAQAVATELIEKRLCVQCHEVTRRPAGQVLVSSEGGSPWTIAPVQITKRWLPNAAFDHGAHKISTCESCHDVKASRTSADIAMPTIATCRTCHSGAAEVPGKVRSPCQTCHSFHLQPVPRSGSLAAASSAATSEGTQAGQ